MVGWDVGLKDHLDGVPQGRLLAVGKFLRGDEGALVAIRSQAGVADGDGVGLHDSVTVVIGDVLDKVLVAIGSRPTGNY